MNNKNTVVPARKKKYESFKNTRRAEFVRGKAKDMKHGQTDRS